MPTPNDIEMELLSRDLTPDDVGKKALIRDGRIVTIYRVDRNARFPVSYLLEHKMVLCGTIRGRAGLPEGDLDLVKIQVDGKPVGCRHEWRTSLGLYRYYEDCIHCSAKREEVE